MFFNEANEVSFGCIFHLNDSQDLNISQALSPQCKNPPPKHAKKVKVNDFLCVLLAQIMVPRFWRLSQCIDYSRKAICEGPVIPRVEQSATEAKSSILWKKVTFCNPQKYLEIRKLTPIGRKQKSWRNQKTPIRWIQRWPFRCLSMNINEYQDGR